MQATYDHQYADAQRRGNPVTLLVSESTGAISPDFFRALCALDKQSRLRTTHDATTYGVSRSSPRTFLDHHLAAHSSAVVLADATTLHSFGTALAFRLSIGIAA